MSGARSGVAKAKAHQGMQRQEIISNHDRPRQPRQCDELTSVSVPPYPAHHTGRQKPNTPVTTASLQSRRRNKPQSSIAGMRWSLPMVLARSSGDRDAGCALNLVHVRLGADHLPTHPNAVELFGLGQQPTPHLVEPITEGAQLLLLNDSPRAPCQDTRHPCYASRPCLYFQARAPALQAKMCCKWNDWVGRDPPVAAWG